MRKPEAGGTYAKNFVKYSAGYTLAPVRGKSETAPRGTARRLTAAVLCLIFMCALLPSCGKNGSALPAAGEYFRYPAVR